MKKLVLLIVVLGITGQICGQEQKEIIKEGNYYFEYVSEAGLNNLKNLSILKNAKNGLSTVKDSVSGTKYRVTVLKVEENDVHFVFWKFDDSPTNKIINNVGANDDSRVIYTLTKDEFKKNTKPLYNKVDWGAGIFTVPFKLRFKDFNFDANVNIGTNIGAKIRFNREIENGFSLEPIFGIGLASIKLDDSNSGVDSATNISAFSINTGILIHITEEINIGLTYGFDNISNNDQEQYNWKHNGKGWLGIGINVAFSKPAKNTGDIGKQ